MIGLVEMSIPLHIFEEIVILAREMEKVKDDDRTESFYGQIPRYKQIKYRLGDIKRAYTFDSDQEEQMV